MLTLTGVICWRWRAAFPSSFTLPSPRSRYPKKKVVVVFVVAGVGADVGSVVVIAVIVVGVGVVLVVDFDDGCQAGVDNNQGATTISFASSRTTRPA